MKLHHFGAIALMALNTLAQAGTNVGVSVSVNQPGFYGRVDIGQQPPPVVVYQQPVIIEQSPIAMSRRPIYLRVPTLHSQRWAQYCSRYRACGQRVYFVGRPWVRGEPQRHWEERRYEERHEMRHERGDRGRGKGRGHDKHGHGHGH